MKKTLLLAALCCMTLSSFATKYTVSASGMVFTPATGITMHVGDTIMWVWVDGVHTTTSTSAIPSGAAPWNSNLSSSVASFIYKPTVAGTYNYQCTFHASMGMTGSFTVLGATGVMQVNNSVSTFSVFPNPVTNIVHVQFDSDIPAVLTLTSVEGKEVIRKQYATVSTTDLDLKNVPNGIYSICVMQHGQVNKQQLVVSH
ncbi:MAG: hypothetical protein JWQ38_2439 [Flavipsychrobacter sp.]|nr:hypothetical protein [Flavipsychrobacter sp.]